jgi:hypothetical protein
VTAADASGRPGRRSAIRLLAKPSHDRLEVEAQPPLSPTQPDRSELVSVGIDPAPLDAQRPRQGGGIDVPRGLSDSRAVHEQGGYALGDPVYVGGVELQGAGRGLSA